MSEAMDGTRDRALGCFLGLAVGDALGTTVEFRARGTFAPVTGLVGGGPFRLLPGQWTDDTSMAICLGESLLHDPLLDPADLMARFLRWYRHGENSSTGECFDIGNATRAALMRYERSGDPLAGDPSPNAAGRWRCGTGAARAGRRAWRSGSRSAPTPRRWPSPAARCWRRCCARSSPGGASGR